MKDLTPREIVTELDRYIIGQIAAKKSVAIALRNRYRRSLLPKEIQEEITPKNIIMIGPTGVGKTEIARRLAKLIDAPFIKVEATKFTEVGYVGRDVESMIRDLINTSIRNIKQKKMNEVKKKAKELADELIVEIMVPQTGKNKKIKNPFDMFFNNNNSEVEPEVEEKQEPIEDINNKHKVIMEKLKNNELEDEIIEIEIEDNNTSSVGVLAGMNLDDMNLNMNDIFGGILPKKTKKRKVTIKEAKEILSQQEAQKLIDMDAVIAEGIKNAEQNGIIFLDEIDKIAGHGYKNGPDVSREGVQRDILPIVEGCTVNTKYGPVKTDYILFIGAGAFSMSKVSDLIPELQGRFPIKVKLDNLTPENFNMILTQPENSIIKQYYELLKTENVFLEFTDESIEEISLIATYLNQHQENIGARRLHTVIERILEEISFYAPNYDQDRFVVTKEYVKNIYNKEENANEINKYIL